MKGATLRASVFTRAFHRYRWPLTSIKKTPDLDATNKEAPVISTSLRGLSLTSFPVNSHGHRGAPLPRFPSRPRPRCMKQAGGPARPGRACGGGVGRLLGGGVPDGRGAGPPGRPGRMTGAELSTPSVPPPVAVLEVTSPVAEHPGVESGDRGRAVGLHQEAAHPDGVQS